MGKDELKGERRNIYIKYQREEKHQIIYSYLSCWYTQGSAACKHALFPVGVWKTHATAETRRLQFAFSRFHSLYVENYVSNTITSYFVASVAN
jgi:hypothetical protein